MRNLIVNILLTSFIVLFLASCASNEEVEVKTFIAPEAPEKPKIMHLKTIRGEDDLKKVKKKKGFIETLVGEQLIQGRSFVKPYGVTVFKNKIYVTDTGFGVVFILDTKKETTSFLGDKNSGKLSLPVGIAVDNNENVYVTDSKLQRVFGYDKKGKLIFVLGNDDEFIRPSGIAINRELEIMYIVDTKGHTIRAFSLNGDFLFDIGERGKADGEFNFPTNIAVDPNSGNVVVVDTQNFRVQIFDQDGNHIKSFGNAGDVPGTFARPKGVGIDSDGNIYISDAAFDNIQIFDKTGSRFLMDFGHTGSEPGMFQMPASLFIDEHDRIHVSENYSGQVQILQYIGAKYKEENAADYKALMKSRKIEE